MTRTFITFNNNTQGMFLHQVLDEAGIENRVSPTPRTKDLKVPCGMSLLVNAEDEEVIRKLAHDNDAQFVDIVHVEF